VTQFHSSLNCRQRVGLRRSSVLGTRQIALQRTNCVISAHVILFFGCMSYTINKSVNIHTFMLLSVLYIMHEVITYCNRCYILLRKLVMIDERTTAQTVLLPVRSRHCSIWSWINRYPISRKLAFLHEVNFTEMDEWTMIRVDNDTLIMATIYRGWRKKLTQFKQGGCESDKRWCYLTEPD